MGLCRGSNHIRVGEAHFQGDAATMFLFTQSYRASPASSKHAVFTECGSASGRFRHIEGAGAVPAFSTYKKNNKALALKPSERLAVFDSFYTGCTDRVGHIGCAVFSDSASFSRLVMFFKLIPRVEALCRSANVVGGNTPATPSMIRERLNPTIKR